MAKVTLIYAYWPSQPFGVTWCDLPWALRDAGLPKRLFEAGHEVVESMLMTEEDHPEELRSGFLLARQIADEVAKALKEGELPVILCGSCAVAAVGAVAGLAAASRSARTGIVWLDAHPDLNTPQTTVSGLFEGMALAVATGHAWQGMAMSHVGLEPAELSAAVLYGARDIDPAEHDLIRAHDVPIATGIDDIERRLDGTDRTYVHLDMDVHDALQVRSNAFPAPGGPKVSDVRSLLSGIPRPAVLSVTGLDPASADMKTAADIAIGHVQAVLDARDQA